MTPPTCRSLTVAAVVAAALPTGLAGATSNNATPVVFAGTTAAGFVRLYAPRQPMTHLAFVAETQPLGLLRVLMLACDHAGCETHRAILPGSLTLSAGKVTLTTRHPSLGDLRLSGKATQTGAGPDVCEIDFGPADEPRAFDYQATGNNHIVAWTGTVGSRRVLSSPVNGCDKYQAPGVLAVTVT